MASRGRMQWPWVTALPHCLQPRLDTGGPSRPAPRDGQSQSPSQGLDGLPRQIPMLFPLCVPGTERLWLKGTGAPNSRP